MTRVSSFLPNRHDFNFVLPMNPISDGRSTKLEMDGRKLEGVTSLCVKAGANGFTNVAIELEADCAVAFVGHLVASLENSLNNEDANLLLAGLYRRAQAEIEQELEQDGGELATDHTAQAKLVRKVISLLIENIV